MRSRAPSATMADDAKRTSAWTAGVDAWAWKDKDPSVRVQRRVCKDWNGWYGVELERL